MTFHPGEFHPGEEQLHELLKVPRTTNPSSPGLSPHAARLLLQHSPLLALGVLDEQGWPWTTVLSSPLSDLPRDNSGGLKGPTSLLRKDLVGVSATIADLAEKSGLVPEKVKDDPVSEVILSRFSSSHSGSASQRADAGPNDIQTIPVGALGIDLENRDRVKISGQIVAAETGSANDRADDTRLNMAVFVEWSLGKPSIHSRDCKKSTFVLRDCKLSVSSGNCPKYLNKKHIVHHTPNPSVRSRTLPLPPKALALLEKADLFFISSSLSGSNLGTNHRGGPPGFVRVARNDESADGVHAAGTTLVYPEYSGNRLYQTLGNLIITPRAGLVFPDFDTGDALFVTGEAEIVTGSDAAALLPRSNLVVKIHVHAARFVENVLAFRAQAGERSPYNPVVRYLPTERPATSLDAGKDDRLSAELISRTLLTPTIARFRFSLSDAAAAHWHAGQYVAFDFADELSGGYSHMREDDPRSLNDDYVRTFTVSSPDPQVKGPSGHDTDMAKADIPNRGEFDITIRNVGKVTNFLFRQNIRAALDVPLKGFGGTFHISEESDGPGKPKPGPADLIIPFVAGGIGITPLLAHLLELDLSKLRLYWAIGIRDVGLVLDTMKRFPSLPESTKLFVSGAQSRDEDRAEGEEVKEIQGLGMKQVTMRRLQSSDLEDFPDVSQTWYVCAGPALRTGILKWLGSRKVIYEDFDY